MRCFRCRFFSRAFLIDIVYCRTLDSVLIHPFRKMWSPQRLQFDCILLVAMPRNAPRNTSVRVLHASRKIHSEKIARSNNLLKINFQHNLLMFYLFKLSLSFCCIVRSVRFAIRGGLKRLVHSFVRRPFDHWSKEILNSCKIRKRQQIADIG